MSSRTRSKSASLKPGARVAATTGTADTADSPAHAETAQTNSPIDPARPTGQPRAGPLAEVAPRRSRSTHLHGNRYLQIGFGVMSVMLSLLVLYLIRDVIGAFVLGALLAFLIGPLVDRIEAAGIPRPIGILIVFAVLGGVAAVLISMLAPLVASEVTDLQAQAPGIAATAQVQLSGLKGSQIRILGFPVDLSAAADSITRNANGFLLGQFGNAISIGLAAVTTILQVLLMLIVAFLVALDSHAIARFLRRLVPNDYRGDFDEIWAEIKAMLFAYMRGQLIIAGLIGTASGIAVWILGLRFALALGLLAGVTSLVPYLGPFLGAVPAVLIGLAVSPLRALLVGLVYFAISNVILNFVYPKIVGDAVKLPPILVIVAFIAGFSFGGILGMFVAVPLAATMRILFDYLYPRLYDSPA